MIVSLLWHRLEDDAVDAVDAVTSNRYGFLNPSKAISPFKNDSSSLDSTMQRTPVESEVKLFRSFNVLRMEFRFK